MKIYPAAIPNFQSYLKAHPGDAQVHLVLAETAAEFRRLAPDVFHRRAGRSAGAKQE